MCAGFAAEELKAVVAIPVRNEAERIEGCLQALDLQVGMRAGELGVILFLNNCTDQTAEIVASAVSRCTVGVRVVERVFAGANAGWARREAMDAAACWLDRSGAPLRVILTTDADSCVPPDWVSRNLAAIVAGADAVAGRIALDEKEAARLPKALHARGRLEGEYEALLVELESLIDPFPHDPWPRHCTTSGATLSVRLDTYRRIGGMPPIAIGEDKAFVSSLLSSDALVRHDPSIVVVTSGRLDGRAVGGAADTMRLRCERPDSPCDARLETLPRALFRYAWRRRLRRLRAGGWMARHNLWAPWLRVEPTAARHAAEAETIGAMLAHVEAASPLLTHRALRPSQLPAHIRSARLARMLLRQHGRLRCAISGLSPRTALRTVSSETEQARP